MSEITFTIDGKTCKGRPGQTIIDAARENGVYIPALCNLQGLKPVGACRICTVKVNGRPAAACTQPLAEGMAVENATPELDDLRRSLVEMLIVEGNHLCPTCEKSGNCELQALGYRLRVLSPRFPFQFPRREVQPAGPRMLFDQNRCVQCQRCVRAVVGEGGKKVFAPQNRSKRMTIAADPDLVAGLTEEEARRAMEACPVGALLRKEIGFAVPVGKRKYDKAPIGSDVENGPAR